MVSNEPLAVPIQTKNPNGATQRLTVRTMR